MLSCALLPRFALVIPLLHRFLDVCGRHIGMPSLYRSLTLIPRPGRSAYRVRHQIRCVQAPLEQFVLRYHGYMALGTRCQGWVMPLSLAIPHVGQITEPHLIT